MVAVEADDRSTGGAKSQPRRRGTRLTVLGIVALCIAPVIASYVAYYFYPPEGRSVYGALIQPQIALGEFGGTPLAAEGDKASAEGQAGKATFAELRGRWTMVMVAPGACPGDCPERLYALRQVRLAQGRDADRVERVWLVSDATRPAAGLLADYAGTRVWFAAPEQLQQKFPAAAATEGFARIYVVDPLGHLMMQFPIGADPGRIRKDIARLLKISRIG